MILAGDIGGTNARLGLFREESGRPVPELARTLASRDYPGPEAVLAEFLDGAGTARPDAACLGVAGPVVGGRCEAPNLPWTVEAGQIARVLGLDHVLLINDLVATGYGLPLLGPADSVEVQAGRPAPGNEALVCPGTGLGEAGLFWDGGIHRPLASEGGHADFAPRDPLEIELLTWMLRRHDHVSWERLLSGNGLVEIHRFLRDTGRGDEPPWMADELRREKDPAALIAAAAFEGRSQLCELAVERFVRILGAEVGNVALRFLSLGGVWLGGGIVARWLGRDGPGEASLPHADAFREAFIGKGRFRRLLEGVPVRAIRNEGVALLGAARLGLGLVAGPRA